MGGDSVFKLIPQMPLGGVSKSWAGLNIAEVFSGELVSVAFDDDNSKKLNTRFKKKYGVVPPGPNTFVSIQGGSAFWSGQNQLMLLLDGENINADKDVAIKLDGLAYTSLQSDSWASLTVGGERVYDVLERFTALDLRQPRDGFAARSSAHHMAVFILKLSKTKFHLLTPRSSAQSFYDALCHTADNVI